MIALIEATFFKFQYITGIERHFFLQLDLFQKSRIFTKLIIITCCEIPKQLLYQYKIDIEVVTIKSNDCDNWNKIFENTHFDIFYSTFDLPPILPQNKPVFFVLHDPGRYLYPQLMENDVLTECEKRFEMFISKENFHVITVSNTSKREIESIFTILKDKVSVIYNFADTYFCEDKKKETKEDCFFITIGRYMPTKNTLNLVKAFEERNHCFKDYKLLIIGRKGWYDEFESYMIISKPQNVELLDYIDDKTLLNLYQNAYGVIIPSFYEGFGLSIVEAIEAGCNRLFCSNIDVFREICPSNVYFFNPYEINEISDIVFSKFVPKEIYKYDDKFTFNSVLISFINLFNYAKV
ncbi:hypothetical protein FACS189411_10830 [Bacteroidia bacterium]|nr:hypothetical protein FACS189411_10830 [Bacteroidia bacterium]